jgi:hypothetical protein
LDRSTAWRWDIAIIFGLSLSIFMWGISQQEVISFDARFYLFAREMWRAGLSYFPTTYGQYYPDYPATSTILIYAAAKLFGGLNKATAILPTAIAAALTMATTYAIGALQSRRWGWYSVGFLLMTLPFIMAARAISLDMFVTLVTTLSFYLVYRAYLQCSSPSGLTLALLLAIGFAIRGPLGLIAPAGVLVSFYLVIGEYKNFIKISLLAFVLLLICCGILLALANHAGGKDLVHAVINMQGVGRLHDARTPPYYFYFVQNLLQYALTYPLALLIFASLFYRLRNHSILPEKLLLKLLLSWIVILLVGLSIPADKKIRYVLAIAPALSLACAYLYASENLGKYLKNLQKGFQYFCVLLPLLVIGSLFFFAAKKLLPLNLGLLIGFISLALLSIWWRKNAALVFWLTVVTFVSSNLFIVEPINLRINATQQFVNQVEKVRQKNKLILGFYREGTDGLVIKYLVDSPVAIMPLFLNAAAELAGTKPGMVLITQVEYLTQIPAGIFHVIGYGQIGHTEVAVLTNTSVLHFPGGF